MRNIIKHTSIIVIALILVLCMAVPAFAADGTVTYEGNGEFKFGPGTDLSATQLFPDFEGVMPGDELTQKVTITNKSGKTDYVKFYLRAEAHEDELHTAVGDTETVASMSDFLAQLSMTVKNGSEVIYEASPDQTDGLTDDVYLGSLKNGESLDLIVTITVPIDLDNKYANRSGEVDWVFKVEELNSDASLDITMEETSDPEDKNGYQEGEEIEYKIVVTNDGNVTLTDVTVTDPETGDTWTVETLELGEKVEFTTTHKVTEEDAEAGKFENTASATGTPDNPDLPEVTAGPVKVTSTTYIPSEVQTGDNSNILLWSGLFAAALIAVAVLLIVSRRKREQ